MTGEFGSVEETIAKLRAVAQPLPFPPLVLPDVGVDPVWWPINSAQQYLLNCLAQLALFGGQSGGGKTQVLVNDAVQEYRNPALKGLLLRTTLAEMQELEYLQERLYEQPPYRARWKRTRGVGRWLFPAGGSIQPGYLAQEKHLKRYVGNPRTYIGIDEGQQHPEAWIRRLIAWLIAPTGSGIFARMRITANPGDIGHGYLSKVFLRNRCPVHYPAPPDDSRPYETSVVPGKVYRGAKWTDDSEVYKTTCFIPARLIDNPLYGVDKFASLLSQTKAVQMQLLYGCWCNAAGLYFDFMRPDDVVAYPTIGDSWWWSHFIAVDFGFGNSAASAGFYAVAPNGTVFKSRERVERKMSAENFALGICKRGFELTRDPYQPPENNWLEKLKKRDPDKPRISFCVMDSHMDQHTGTGKSVFRIMADVFEKHGIGCLKAASDPQGNAQELYNGLSNKRLVLTRHSIELPLSYRSLATRVVDERKAVKKIHGAWEDDVYDETSYGFNTWRENSKMPARTKLEEEVQEMRRGGIDETTIARVAWKREQEIQAEEKRAARGIPLGPSLGTPKGRR